MADEVYVEPKTDYAHGDQVTPSIFNNLGLSIKYLQLVKSGIEIKDNTNTTEQIATIVFVEE